MDKKIFIFILVAVVLLIGGYFLLNNRAPKEKLETDIFAVEYNPATAALSQLKEDYYSNNALGVRVRPPIGWELNEKESIFAFSHPNYTEGSVQLFFFSRGKREDIKTTDEIIRLTHKAVSSGNYTLINEQLIKLASGNMYIAEYREASEPSIIQLEGTLSSNDKVYTIHARVSGEIYNEEYKDLLLAVFSTFSPTNQ